MSNSWQLLPKYEDEEKTFRIVGSSWASPIGTIATLDSESILSLVSSVTGPLRVDCSVNPFLPDLIRRWNIADRRHVDYETVMFQGGDAIVGRQAIKLPGDSADIEFRFTPQDGLPISLNGHSILSIVEWLSDKSTAMSLRSETPPIWLLRTIELLQGEQFDWDGEPATFDMITAKDGELLFIGFHDRGLPIGSTVVTAQEAVGLFGKGIKLSVRDQYISNLLRQVNAANMNTTPFIGHPNPMPVISSGSTAHWKVSTDPYRSPSAYFGIGDDEAK